MTFSLRTAAIAASMFMLAGVAAAGAAQPPTVEPQKPALSAQGLDLKATLAVERIKVSILQGEELGGITGGWLCAFRRPITASEDFLKNYGGNVTTIVTQELKRLGYPLARMGKVSAFDSDVAAAPDFRVGGIVTDVRYEMCWLDDNAEGWVYHKVDWALFSEKQQKVVYQATTEGLSVSKEKIPDLAKRAVIASLGNFLSSPAVLDALKAHGAEAIPAAAAAAAASATAPAR